MKETRNIKGHIIEIGKQDFENNVVPVTDKNGTILCHMYSDDEGNFYFVYKGIGVYFSDYLGLVMQ